jgi:uncharacterized coiled-coil DUF342 family protein
MNTMKSIYNKLFKEESTELASHEVKLSIADEIKTSIQKGKFAYDDLNESLSGYIEIKKQFDDLYKKSNDKHNQVKRFVEQVQKWDGDSLTIYKKVLNASKELGIQKEQINGIAEFEKLIGNIGKLRGDAQRILSQH